MSLQDNPFGPAHRVVDRSSWREEATGLHRAGYTFFDWLSAVDEEDDGFRVVVHVARLADSGIADHLLLATMVPVDDPSIESLTSVYRGAAWHERETHEMFGIDFGVRLEPLLLPDGFEGHPLRKDFVLASRVAKPWPGAKEPGEADADSAHSPSRRRLRPPGVPDPEVWGGRTDA